MYNDLYITRILGEYPRIFVPNIMFCFCRVQNVTFFFFNDLVELDWTDYKMIKMIV